MTDDRVTGFASDDNEGILQFALNFSVYVLPPNAVCLYSEDRKFFLHGELYCALADAIGKGGKTFRQLARQLSGDFPSDKIQEALERLVDRNFVVTGSPINAGAGAAYWASLGLTAETAEKIFEIAGCAFSRSKQRVQRNLALR